MICQECDLDVNQEDYNAKLKCCRWCAENINFVSGRKNWEILSIQERSKINEIMRVRRQKIQEDDLYEDEASRL